MIRFDEILCALAAGRSVRRLEWEENLRMYVADKNLVCKVGDSRPYRHDLSWDDVQAEDWEIVEDLCAQPHRQTIRAAPFALASDRDGMLGEEAGIGSSLVLFLSSRKWKL